MYYATDEAKWQPITTRPIAASVDATRLVVPPTNSATTKVREEDTDEGCTEGRAALMAVAATTTEREPWEISDNELHMHVPAPDFPTGGIIMGTTGARKMYTTGHGSVTVRARASIEAIEVSLSEGNVHERPLFASTYCPFNISPCASLFLHFPDMHYPPYLNFKIN